MRRPVVNRKPRVSNLRTFPAATSGWISNQNLSSPSPRVQGAVVLDNFFPTATGTRLRRGSVLYATLGNGTQNVTSIFSYNNGSNRRLFASTETDIYDITNIVTPFNYRLKTDEDDLIVTDEGDYIGEFSTSGLDVVSGQVGGAWIVTQFATSGGTFLVAVNGTDPMQIYDGSEWYPITSEQINTLSFDAETSPFVEGEIVTGGTSGATGTIIRVETDGTAGIFVLGTITGGPFVDDEILTGSITGDAVANGGSTILFNGITGVSTASLSYVWTYKNRLFFIEKDSMTAWYLPIDQIGGTATSFPMGGVFSIGGSLLFGSSWSLDSSGDGGLSEQCIFITTEGEVAVYQGTNPSSAPDWQKVGTYRIGKPLGPEAWIRAGGDIVVATDIGFVPLSQAIQRDYAALSPAAVSFPIETAWNDAVSARRSAYWHCAVWPDRQMVVVALPTLAGQNPEIYVTNARTGAWARFTGWDGKCLEVFQGRLFYGTTEGRVIEAYVSGLDQGQTYTATSVPLFTDFGQGASIKIANIARVTTRGPYEVEAQLSVMENYMVELPSPPSSLPIEGGSQWGVGIWGSSVWGDEPTTKVQQYWTSVGGRGYALAPAVQITSGSVVPNDVEIISTDLSYDTADIIS